MLDVLFWILFSLVLLIVIPDRWHARREIAKRGIKMSERNPKIVAEEQRKMLHGGWGEGK